MGTVTGTLYRYADPVGRAPMAAQMSPDGRAAVQFRSKLAALGVSAATVVTDIGDETVGEHRVKLIGWLDPDGDPRVTSLCLRQFAENFRKVVPA